MDKMNEVFLIKRLMADHELQEGQNFISELYFEKYHSPRMPLPSIFFGAYLNGAITGTVGLELEDADGKLPLEYLYDFDVTRTPWRFETGRVVQFSRFGAKNGAGALLLFAATRFSQRLGKHYGLYESKAPITSYMQHFGIAFEAVRGAALVQSRIPPGHAYYNTQPLPTLFMSLLSQKEQALRRQLAKFLATVRYVDC